MDNKKYRLLRALGSFFVAMIVSVAIVRGSYLLAVAGMMTGVAFMLLVRGKARIRTDERESSIQEKAAKMTYAVFTPTIGIAALLLLFPSKSGIGVFGKGEWVFTESLGMVFAYLTLFIMSVYSISYHFLNRKFGGGSDE